MPFNDQLPSEQLRRVMELVPNTANQYNWNTSLNGSQILDIFEDKIKLTEQLKPSFFQQMRANTFWSTQDAFLMDVPFATEGKFCPVMTVVPHNKYKVASIMQMVYTPTATYSRTDASLDSWTPFVRISGDGSGELPAPRSLVTTINGKQPDPSGNIDTDYVVVEAIDPSTSWTEYRHGKTEFYTEYKKSQLRSLDPSLAILPEGNIVVRTLVEPETSIAYQQVDSVSNGLFNGAFVRVGNVDGTWGSLVKAMADVGPQGPEGPIGPRGPAGVDGMNGAVGPVGPVGPRGFTGDAGQNGERGATGLQGVQGISGPAGPQGERGPMGDGFTITKTYPTVAAMNADVYNPNISQGAFVIISSANPDTDPDNSKVYVKTPNGYVFQSVLRGLKGETGSQGIQGPQGLQGPQGVTGPQGIAGPRGAVGPAGKSLTVKGTKVDEGGLPLTGQVGDAYWTEDGHLYAWSDDPTVVSPPDWVRSPSLRGPQGPAGPSGGGGPAVVNATKTAKGIMQVGDGLNVTDGVVSINAASLQTTALPHTATFAEYPEGTVTRRVTSSSTDPSYIYYNSLVKDLIGPDLIAVNNGNYFRFFVTTVKVNNSGYQKVEVTTNVTGMMFPAFQLNRVFSDGNWTDWRATVLNTIGKGDPNGTLTAPFGAAYTDSITGISYIKGGAFNSINSSNWISTNGTTTAAVTKNASFTGTFTANVTKQGIFTRLDLSFVNPNGVSVAAGTEVILGTIPAGFRPPVRDSKFYVGDNTGTRTPRHAIIVYTNGNIGWTPSAAAGFWTMAGSVVY